MGSIVVEVLGEIPGGVQIGSDGCACGGCRPTATTYQEDPLYERHDPKLAEGPCCCGRFFVVSQDASAAEQHASEMSTQINAARRRPHHYRFEHRRVVLPWGETFAVVVANLADQVAMGPIRD